MQTMLVHWIITCTLLFEFSPTIHGFQKCPLFNKFVDSVPVQFNSLVNQKMSCAPTSCTGLNCNGTLPEGLSSTKKLSIRFSAQFDFCVQVIHVNVSLQNGPTIKLILSSDSNSSIKHRMFVAKFHSNVTRSGVNTSNIDILVKEMQGGFDDIHFAGQVERTCTNEPTLPPTHTTAHSKSTMKPSTTMKRSAKPTTKPSTKPTTKSTTKPTTKPTTKQVTKPTTTKPTTKQVTKATTKATKKSKITVKRKTKTKTHLQLTTTARPRTRKRTSRATRALYLIVGILILICVLALVIYCRKKRRLSDLPAYYNDIVINDPLKMEVEGEEGGMGNEQDDGDELPLFS